MALKSVHGLDLTHRQKVFDNCKARIDGRYSNIQAEQSSTKSKSTSTPDPTTKQVSTSRTLQTTRGRAAVSKTPEAPKKDDNWWEAAALFEFMQKAVNQRVVRPGRNQITLDRVAELIVRRYEIEEVETAKNVLWVHAQNLCYMMDHPRRKAIQFFAAEPIYQELAAGHTLSATEQRRAEDVALRPRKDHATLRNGQSDSSDTSDEDEDDAIRTPARRPGRQKKGRLSVLRPKSGKFSGKSKGVRLKAGGQIAGKGKAPVLASSSSSAAQSGNETSSDSDIDMDNTPTQALSPSGEKRKLDDTESEHEAKGTRQKRTTSTSLASSSPPVTNDSDSAEADTEAGAIPSIPLRSLPASSIAGNSRSTVFPQIVSTSLPTYEANGPRDSWICSFDGCTQRIYGCSKQLGRKLITEHLEDHSRGSDKVVGILWREQNRLNLPVK